MEQWRKKDPIERLKKYMEKEGLWNKSYDQGVCSEAKEKVEQAVHEQENFPPPDPRDIFRFTFHELTAELKEQSENFFNANGKRNIRD